jgi:uncharacterized membrane protein
MNLLPIPISYDNSFDIISKLLSMLDIPFTRKALLSKLKEHPNQSNLLGISEVLDEYQVQNISIATSISQLSQLPTPLITQIAGVGKEERLATIVKSVTPEQIEFYELESGRWRLVPLPDFDVIWPSKIAMIVDSERSSGEIGYKINRIVSHVEIALRIAILASLPLLVAFISIDNYRVIGSQTITFLAYEILFLIGLAISGYLFWVECSQDSSTLKKVCQTTKKVNCAAVLKSPGAKLLGISLSTLGSSYFLGCLLSLIVLSPWDKALLFLLSWTSIFSMIMITFSVYYQEYSLKQWCLLCLYVQGTLLALLSVGLWNGWYLVDDIKVSVLLMRIAILGFNLGISLAALCLLRFAYKLVMEKDRLTSELKKLKFDPFSFNGQQANQAHLKLSVDKLGILLGKDTASHQILKICDPYCPHCASSHKAISLLIRENSNVSVRIIFTAPPISEDARFHPVKHFLELYESGDQELLLSAMDYWYLSPDRNIATLTSKFKLPEKGSGQFTNIEKMHVWCRNMEITSTPTIYYNEKLLSDLYDLQDLRYVLSD